MIADRCCHWANPVEGRTWREVDESLAQRSDVVRGVTARSDGNGNEPRRHLRHGNVHVEVTRPPPDRAEEHDVARYTNDPILVVPLFDRATDGDFWSAHEARERFADDRDP